MLLDNQQLQQWKNNGAIHLPRFFTAPQLIQWTDELASWPETAGKWMKYFESSIDQSNNRQLCRIENFLDYHDGWKKTIFDQRLLSILSQLFQEPALLYKEKLNFKLPGGNGFSAHQDAPAFTSFGQKYHITAMISIDPTTTQNGCLEMAFGAHKQGLFEMTPSKVLSAAAIDTLKWKPIETDPGDLLLFDSYIPHRSGPNHSQQPRRAAYITYNPLSQHDRRLHYYQHKRQVFPPEIERIPGKSYDNSGIYNIGNPIRK